MGAKQVAQVFIVLEDYFASFLACARTLAQRFFVAFTPQISTPVEPTIEGNWMKGFGATTYVAQKPLSTANLRRSGPNGR
jgi:hypothetical protein